jgi:hypothetical protein
LPALSQELKTELITNFPGGEFSVPVSGQVSIRSASGTGNVVLNMLIEEIDG